MTNFQKLLRSSGWSKDGAHGYDLQQSVIDAEAEQRETGHEYSKQHVRQSIVHTRQDTVLVISHLTILNQTARKIVRRLNLLVLLALAILGVLIFNRAFF